MAIQDFLDSMEDECTLIGSADFRWSAKGCGFGQLYFYTKEDDIVYCDNEMMSKAFIKKMLCKMVDDAVMNCPSKKDLKDE